MTTRDIYPRHVKRGMIIRWHPSQFPANRPPAWFQVLNVEEGFVDQVWIEYAILADDDSQVKTTGRWYYDTTILQARENP